MFHHAGRRIRALVHGDDYVASGSSADLEWFEAELMKAYEIQTQRLGFAKGRPREAKVLNRILRCTEEGFEIEADPRHAELVIEQMQVEGEKPAVTPGVSGADEDDADDDVFLQGADIKSYRGLAARCNYLGPDRLDALYAIKRRMSGNVEADYGILEEA